VPIDAESKGTQSIFDQPIQTVAQVVDGCSQTDPPPIAWCPHANEETQSAAIKMWQKLPASFFVKEERFASDAHGSGVTGPLRLSLNADRSKMERMQALGRRIMNLGLARAWETWLERNEEAHWAARLAELAELDTPALISMRRRIVFGMEKVAAWEAWKGSCRRLCRCSHCAQERAALLQRLGPKLGGRAALLVGPHLPSDHRYFRPTPVAHVGVQTEPSPAETCDASAGTAGETAPPWVTEASHASTQTRRPLWMDATGKGEYRWVCGAKCKGHPSFLTPTPPIVTLQLALTPCVDPDGRVTMEEATRLEKKLGLRLDREQKMVLLDVCEACEP
jgi:hypothetical protein